MENKITFLGWRENKLTHYITLCYNLSNKLAQEGFEIVTGSGSGFMETANKGAFDISPHQSHGVAVNFLTKEKPNQYIPKSNLDITYDFYSRKMILLTSSKFLVFFPGGMGTLDEFAEIINLVKCDPRLPKVYIFLVGFKFWNDMRNTFICNGLNFPDEYIQYIGDNIEYIIEKIKELKNIY